MLRALLLALLCLAGAAGAASAQGTEQPVPALSGRIVDTAGALGATQRTALEEKLARYERAAGPQIVVLIVATTQPEDIAAYAQRVADRWKIGRRDVGDGLLIVVARDDRKVRIEVAKALEGAVPDLAARQIIDAAIKPAFQAGDYAGGLNQAIDRLQARIAGEHLPAPAQPEARPGPSGAGSSGGLDFEGLGMLLFLGVPIAAMLLTGLLGRKLGSLATAGAAGAAGWMLGGSAAIAGIAAVAALVLVGVLGIGAARGGRGGGPSLAGVRDQRYRRGGSGVIVPPIIWGGGGFGGGGGSGGGGGFSSGGGGDFGGGGASGDW